jgi:elongation factor P
MKINVNELKPGYVIKYRDRLWAMVKGEHVKPGKGPAYLQAELRCLNDGSKLNQRFNTSETVDHVELDKARYQFLYDDGALLNLMHTETFEQMTLERSLVGDAGAYLQEGMIVTVQSFEGRPLAAQIPDSVVMEVVEADPVVRGQTAASSYKPAQLENGQRIKVPPHIERGTRVVVNTGTGAYVERARD